MPCVPPLSKRVLLPYSSCGGPSSLANHVLLRLAAACLLTVQGQLLLPAFVEVCWVQRPIFWSSPINISPYPSVYRTQQPICPGRLQWIDLSHQTARISLTASASSPSFPCARTRGVRRLPFFMSSAVARPLSSAGNDLSPPASRGAVRGDLFLLVVGGFRAFICGRRQHSLPPARRCVGHGGHLLVVRGCVVNYLGPRRAPS